MGRLEIPKLTQVYLPQRHLDAPVAPVAPVARGPWIQPDAHQRPPLVGWQPFPLQASFCCLYRMELEQSTEVTEVCNYRLKFEHCFALAHNSSTSTSTGNYQNAPNVPASSHFPQLFWNACKQVCDSRGMRKGCPSTSCSPTACCLPSGLSASTNPCAGM